MAVLPALARRGPLHVIVRSNLPSTRIRPTTSPLGALGCEKHHTLPSWSRRAASRAIRVQRRHVSSDSSPAASIFAPLDTFARRHVGPSDAEAARMLAALDPPVPSLDEFVKQVVPSDILASRSLTIEAVPGDSAQQDGLSESALLARARHLAALNKPLRSYIGCGYAGTRVPEVIRRNVLESPAWYTPYTPYQPELSQGRLESLLNFQTLITDMTALPIANASVLDEPTAAAEAMALAANASGARGSRNVFVVSHRCHPQTIAVLQSRAEGVGITIDVRDIRAEAAALDELGSRLIGVLAQYPDTEGGVFDFKDLAARTHQHGGIFCVATDLLALTLLRAPGEFGADIAVGSAQRLGVPMGFGGPHAAFLACTDKLKRKIPGRLVGMSKDRRGEPALRLALQTREQHIRREKATSNICTAQALLANMSAFYAVYHGPQGLKAIAQQIVAGARVVEEGLRRIGFTTASEGVNDEGRVVFDTVVVHIPDQRAGEIVQWAKEVQSINLRLLSPSKIGITLDESVTQPDLQDILSVFQAFAPSPEDTPVDLIRSELGLDNLDDVVASKSLQRRSTFLTHPVFNSHHSETHLMRYIYHLQSKDLSLVHSMIPLGSCTMKLNAATEMAPVTWNEFASLHPFAPDDQTRGYRQLIKELEADLATITGFDAVSVQPNSGAQGEFAGLRLIRKYLETQPGGQKRDICLIPVSAHGTNPASAVMAGMRVVPIKCDPRTGDLDFADLTAKCERHADELGALMVTYPSTFGVFEPRIRAICDLVHKHGGQVYMDGANVNAQIGLCAPGAMGADVCHLNLHKTFCIPHGGGGPGVGPIAVKAHLAPFLPGHPLSADVGGTQAIAPISGAPWGSAGILPISWAYIKMMGARALTHATKITLLNANYLLARLRPHYPILHVNSQGRCAHEFILDLRPFTQSSGIVALDVAKRLQDFGFHAPTMSWPVANTLMIEPTESESLDELDRFVAALVAIRGEIAAVERGEQPRDGNVLKMAPHTMQDLLDGDDGHSAWDRPYSREQAAYPLPWLREKKFWPTVTRLDDTYGDMNLFCTCSPVEPDD